MPPENFEEKTEAPTPRRRQEARQRGQVARSTDLTAAGALLGAMIILNIFGPIAIRSFLKLTETVLGYNAPDSVKLDSMFNLSTLAIGMLGKIIAPLCILIMLIAVLVTLAQVGFIFSTHPLAPDLEKINPVTGFMRIFSIQSLIRLGISAVKILLIGIVAVLTINSYLPVIVNLAGQDYWQILAIWGQLIFTLGIRLGLVLLIIGIVDYAYNRHRYEMNLKMTRQELKEELRRMEGDPLVRERRKRVAQQLAMQRMRFAVPKADVVITNPTEYAIAIKYDPETMNAPKVIAKGAGFLAKRIREIAIQFGVPIVERKPLAQSLYKTVEVGQEIPPAFYRAVAEILAYVYEITGKRPVMKTA